MAKKWRNLDTFSLEVGALPRHCKPGETVTLSLRADMDEDVRVDLDLPVDLPVAGSECALQAGSGQVEIRPAIPGEYEIMIRAIHSNRAGCFVSSPLGKAAFSGQPLTVGKVHCSWR